MTTMISELYTALKAAGVDDDIARAAAKSVIAIEDKEQLATKADLADLRRDIAELKADLTRTMMTLMIAMTAIFSAISAALRFVK
jgi:hypothetical protein